MVIAVGGPVLNFSGFMEVPRNALHRSFLSWLSGGKVSILQYSSAARFSNLGNRPSIILLLTTDM